MKWLPPARRILDIAALLHCALIFLLVPTGRWIEACILEFTSELPSLFIAVSIAAGTLLAWITYVLFAFAWRQHGPRESLVTAVSGLCFLSPLVFLKPAPIEFAHVLMFAVLAILVRLTLEGRTTRRSFDLTALALFISFAIALADELLQGLHPRRIFDLRDLWIDLIGIVCGLLIASIFKPRTRAALAWQPARRYSLLGRLKSPSQACRSSTLNR